MMMSGLQNRKLQTHEGADSQIGVQLDQAVYGHMHDVVLLPLGINV